MFRIWDEDDPIYMQAAKCLFFAVTLLIFGWWLVPLRNYFASRHWRRLVIVCNNVPNGMTVLRGLTAIPVVTILVYELARHDPNSVWWFWATIGLFATDGLDGPLARQLDYMTEFGKKADPSVDKVLSIALLVNLPWLTWVNQGWLTGMLIGIIATWIIWVEQDISRITLRSNSLSAKTGIAMHGAYGPGKAKFCLLASGIGVAYGWLVWSHSSTTGTLLAVCVFFPARMLGDKSRALHRTEETSLRKALMQGSTNQDASAA